MSLESTGSRCEQLARQIQMFGRVIPTEEMLGKINAVTDGGHAARGGAAFPRGKPTLATVGPSGAGADAGEYRGDAGGVIKQEFETTDKHRCTQIP